MVLLELPASIAHISISPQQSDGRGPVGLGGPVLIRRYRMSHTGMTQALPLPFTLKSLYLALCV